MTSIEALAKQVSDGSATRQQLVEVFLDTDLMMPSATNPQEKGVSPVLTNIEEIPHIVVATGEDGIKATQHIATWAIQLTGREVIARMATDHGVLINTAEGGIALHPDILAAVREQHGITRPGQ